MQVILFKGLLGKGFSFGIDNLAEKLASAGHTTNQHIKGECNVKSK